MHLPSILKKQTTLATKDEDMLIKGCIAWERNAQNRLYELFAAKMFALCFKYSRSREEAEDTFHEGFMKVFENIKNFKSEGSLEGWIRRIMVNTAIEKYRKNSHSSVVVSIDDHHADLNHYHSDDIHSEIAAKEL